MWLHACETSHGPNCYEQVWSQQIKVPRLLRVIDVESNCIIVVPNLATARFVALSYVWGDPGLETLTLRSENVDSLSCRDGLLKDWGRVP